MKKFLSLFMAFVLCLMPMSAMAEATDGGMNAQLEAILEIEPENMTYSQYFLFEHGFHSDEASADSVIFARRTSGGDALLSRMRSLLGATGIDPAALVGDAECPAYEKYDEYVPAELLRRAYAVDRLDPDGVIARFGGACPFPGEEGAPV